VAYAPKNWTNGDIIQAEDLNNIEAGIAANDAEIAAIKNGETNIEIVVEVDEI
jgi:hypothetical protein